MTDISALKKGDRIIFSNGHESPVIDVEEDCSYLHISFVTENEKEVCFYFIKYTGVANATPYEIVKGIKHV